MRLVTYALDDSNAIKMKIGAFVDNDATIVSLTTMEFAGFLVVIACAAFTLEISDTSATLLTISALIMHPPLWGFDYSRS